MAESPGQEQRAFWAVLLAMAVLLLWSVVFPTRTPQRAEGELPGPGSPPGTSTLQGPGESEVAAERPGIPPSSDPAGGGGESASPSGSLLGVLSGSGPLLQRAPQSSAGLRETVRVETRDLVLVFDGAGARLVEAWLPEFEESEGVPVQLIPESGPGALGSVLQVGDSEVPLDRFTFDLVSNAAGPGGQAIVWELPLEEVTIRKTFTVPGEGNVIRVTHELVGDRIGVAGWGLSWAGGLRRTEPGGTSQSRGPYFQGAVLAEGKVQRKNPSNAAKEPLAFPGTTYFVTTQNKYFMAAIVPSGEGQGPAKLWSVQPGSEDSPSMGAEILAERASGGLAADRIDYDVYIGPQDYHDLAQLGLGIEGAMDLGMKWIRPLSRMVLSFLIWLHHLIPNYGFVIVLFSATINLLFFPLTYKSTKSMRDMAALKPRLDALKEKYKDEPQKVSEATMKLYKEAGVNPLGGCLPILLQMPIFFALYAVLFRTIELRQEPFVLWVRDLSQPDVIFHLPFALPLIGTGIAALPIVMGVTSFFQSKMTMTDPNQKAMMYMMPVMMTVIFFSFPSGLVLYWLTSNLFTISTKFFMKPNPVIAESA